jgi:nucleotide-binding universal stress UspA family protein
LRDVRGSQSLGRRIASSARIPFVQSVVHPTDFSPASEAAFAHALAIALVRGTTLHILHVGPAARETWSRFPAVRKTLERWGLLEEGSERSAVFDELDLRVKKVQLQGDPIGQIHEYVRRHRPDLLVVGTEARQGLARWIEPSVAQSIARRTRTMTLFVGRSGRVFVSSRDGRLSVRRILVPIDRSPDPTEAIVKSARIAAAMGEPPVEINLLRMAGGAPPPTDLPEGKAWTWRSINRTGRDDEEILTVAESIEADLIVMATSGRRGMLDALRGSPVERVVQGAACPVLAVPATHRP